VGVPGGDGAGAWEPGADAVLDGLSRDSGELASAVLGQLGEVPAHPNRHAAEAEVMRRGSTSGDEEQYLSWKTHAGSDVPHRE
jgi:hypothetical protein